MCHVLFNNILIWSEQVQNEGVTWHLKNTTRASTQLISRSCNLVIHILVRLCLYYQKLKHVMQIYSCIYLYALGHALIKQTMYTNIDFIFCFNFFFSLNQKKKILKGYKLPPCSSLINTSRSTKRVEGDVDTIVYFSENRHDRVWGLRSSTRQKHCQ